VGILNLSESLNKVVRNRNRIKKGGEEVIDRSNGTNGKMSIEEVLEKDPVIKKLLDEDEVVEYISYKKGGGLILGFIHT